MNINTYKFSINYYELYGKRYFDLFFSIVAFCIFLLPMFFVSFLVLCLDGRPIFFIQERPGKNNIFIKLIKFRTMKNEGNSDQVRITPLGSFLRKTSIDELPSLLNIIKGEISFVGPRPLLIEYLPLYTNEQLKRHKILPGLTGLAQINGRNNLEWIKRFELDILYQKEISLFNDISLILKTFLKVFRMNDINQESETTCKKFTGNL